MRLWYNVDDNTDVTDNDIYVLSMPPFTNGGSVCGGVEMEVRCSGVILSKVAEG